jgi:hypothetical protein
VGLVELDHNGPSCGPLSATVFLHEEIVEGGGGVLYVLQTLAHDAHLGARHGGRCLTAAFTPSPCCFPNELNIDRDRNHSRSGAAVSRVCRDQVNSIESKKIKIKIRKQSILNETLCVPLQRLRNLIAEYLTAQYPPSHDPCSHPHFFTDEAQSLSSLLNANSQGRAHHRQLYYPAHLLHLTTSTLSLSSCHKVIFVISSPANCLERIIRQRTSTWLRKKLGKEIKEEQERRKQLLR